MKKLVSLILCAILMLSLAACGAPAETTAPDESGNTSPSETETTAPTSPIPVSDGDVIGEGAVSFPLTIVDKDGNAIHITVNTDKEIVGEALLELGLVEGEQSEYGLYVKTVNGITADYDVDATYWAFYINDEYAMTGVDQTPIAEGETYTLKVEG